MRITGASILAVRLGEDLASAGRRVRSHLGTAGSIILSGICSNPANRYPLLTGDDPELQRYPLGGRGNRRPECRGNENHQHAHADEPLFPPAYISGYRFYLIETRCETIHALLHSIKTSFHRFRLHVLLLSILPSLILVCKDAVNLRIQGAELLMNCGIISGWWCHRLPLLCE
jgi:hypothetical protein